MELGEFLFNKPEHFSERLGDYCVCVRVILWWLCVGLVFCAWAKPFNNDILVASGLGLASRGNAQTVNDYFFGGFP